MLRPPAGTIRAHVPSPSGSLLRAFLNKKPSSCSGSICLNLCRLTHAKWGNTDLKGKSTGHHVQQQRPSSSRHFSSDAITSKLPLGVCRDEKEPVAVEIQNSD